MSPFSVPRAGILLGQHGNSRLSEPKEWFQLHIALYAPHKPIGIGAPSGDSATLAGVERFLRSKGHKVTQVSRLRARNIFQDKKRLRQVCSERLKALVCARENTVDIWLTFHSYWKSPDLLGPWCCDRLGVPYVMLKGMHANKRRRDRKTLPGFLTHRKALRQADAIFADDLTDVEAVEKLLGPGVHFVPPGIDPAVFYPDPVGAAEFRKRYGLEGVPLIASVAMLRSGVKSQSIRHFLESAALLNTEAHMVVAGDGSERETLETEARRLIPGRYSFTGQLGKEDLRVLFSAADVLAFPGIGESLGMVYLEAMGCGTPVVACAESGPSQLVRHEKTGLLVDSDKPEDFAYAIDRMMRNKKLRDRCGLEGRQHVLRHHIFDDNLNELELVMLELVKASELRPVKDEGFF